jgi:hypothetical protein
MANSIDRDFKGKTLDLFLFSFAPLRETGRTRRNWNYEAVGAEYPEPRKPLSWIDEHWHKFFLEGR